MITYAKKKVWTTIMQKVLRQRLDLWNKTQRCHRQSVNENELSEKISMMICELRVKSGEPRRSQLKTEIKTLNCGKNDFCLLYGHRSKARFLILN